MDAKRTTLFFIVSALILFGWGWLFPAPQPAQNPAPQQAVQPAAAVQAALNPTVPITVATDTVSAVIDEASGDLRGLTLLKYNSTDDEGKPFALFENNQNGVYIAQSDLIDETGRSLTQGLSFKSAKKQYALENGKAQVRLTATTASGLEIAKTYTFTQGSYLIDVRFDVANRSGKPLKAAAAYRVVRDSKTPAGQGYFMSSYTGPVLYTPEGKFQKVSFSDLDDDFQKGRDQAEYERQTQSGWVGISQHYFFSAWILQPKDGASICAAAGCRIDIKRRDGGLYTAGVSAAEPELPAGASQSYAAKLYAGPQTTAELGKIADHLELVKDYGRVHWPATALFWLMDKLHGLTGNWGWAIVLLTVIVKIILYPLNNASYKSMAKMRAVAPKLEALKKQYGDDRMAMQQAMMQMYKDEKINPLGGCLPMLLQIPIFIGLYWAIFSSVELRQAPWLGWITDLSRHDPWFILPVLMTATMMFQTTLNPPPSDPMQAKMMKIMPLVFSVMFFFFPAGLVLYYVVNNILTIAQQMHVNRSIERARKNGEVVA